MTKKSDGKIILAESDKLKKEDSPNTKLKKKNFINMFYESTGNVSHICKTLNMSRQCYYEWMEKDPEFASAINNESEALLDFAESKLFEKMNSGDVISLLFFLKCKGKSRGYVEKVEHDVRGALFEHLKVEIEFIERGNGDKRDQD